MAVVGGVRRWRNIRTIAVRVGHIRLYFDDLRTLHYGRFYLWLVMVRFVYRLSLVAAGEALSAEGDNTDKAEDGDDDSGDAASAHDYGRANHRRVNIVIGRHVVSAPER